MIKKTTILLIAFCLSYPISAQKFTFPKGIYLTIPFAAFAQSMGIQGSQLKPYEMLRENMYDLMGIQFYFQTRLNANVSFGTHYLTNALPSYSSIFEEIKAKQSYKIDVYPQTYSLQLGLGYDYLRRNNFSLECKVSYCLFDSPWLSLYGDYFPNNELIKFNDDEFIATKHLYQTNAVSTGFKGKWSLNQSLNIDYHHFRLSLMGGFNFYSGGEIFNELNEISSINSYHKTVVIKVPVQVGMQYGVIFRKYFRLTKNKPFAN